MIGSHDTFTYLKSTSCVYNHCTKFWKTQCKSIEEQYAFGIRFFDIRVYRDGIKWRTCHGICNFKQTFPSLKAICEMMNSKFPESIYRIVLEKGNDSNTFIKEATSPLTRMPNITLCDLYENLWRVDIKSRKTWLGSVCNNNNNLYLRGYKFALVDTWTPPANELHGNVTTNNFYKINLKKEARKINTNLDFFKDPEKLKTMITSKDELYFLDYCTNQY